MSHEVQNIRQLVFKYEEESYPHEMTAITNLLRQLQQFIKLHNKDKYDINLFIGNIHFSHNSEYGIHKMLVDVRYFQEFCSKCGRKVDHEYDKIHDDGSSV